MRYGTLSVSGVTERPSHYLGPGEGSVRPVVLAVLEGPDSRAADSEDRCWEPSPGVLVDLPAGTSGPHPKGLYGDESGPTLVSMAVPILRPHSIPYWPPVVIAGTGRGGAARNDEEVVAGVPANKCGFLTTNSASNCVTRESSRDLVFTMSLKTLLSYMIRSGTKQAALKVSRLTSNKVSSAAVKFNLAKNCSHFIFPR